MTAVLYDEVVTATPARRLRAVPAPTPIAVPAPKRTSRRPEQQFVGGAPLVVGAARVLRVPLRQLYGARPSWRLAPNQTLSRSRHLRCRDRRHCWAAMRADSPFW